MDKFKKKEALWPAGRHQELSEILQVFNACKNKKEVLKNLFNLLSEQKLILFLEICFNLIYTTELTDGNKKFKTKINRLRKLMRPHEKEWVRIVTLKCKSQKKHRKFLQSQVGDGAGVVSVIGAIVSLVPALLNL